jgi:hypothetical protein
MKKLALLSLVGITSIALAHTGWAAGHGGGGGGFGGGGFHGGGFSGGGFHGGGHFSSMPGGHTFVRGGTHTWGGRNWSGRNWNGNWRHHRFSNDVVFIGDVGFPWWWGWYDPYGYYGYDYYPLRFLWVRRVWIRPVRLLRSLRLQTPPWQPIREYTPFAKSVTSAGYDAAKRTATAAR